MSYNIYPIIGMVLTIILSIIASLLTGGLQDIRAEDKDLVHPWAWKIFGTTKSIKEEYVLTENNTLKCEEKEDVSKI